MDLAALREPIVQAPLAGGGSTPGLAAAVNEAGGLGFLAAGYKTAGMVRDEIHTLRSLTGEPFGVNIFSPPMPVTKGRGLESYSTRLQPEAERYRVQLGEPRHDDDDFDAKCKLVADERVPVVAFTFGCPEPDMVARLHAAGCDVWVTVTNPHEAGGHRGYFKDESDAEDLGLLVALRLVAHRVGLPLIAAGGIAEGQSVAAVLCAGAAAAQIGSALMLSPEAGTSAPHRSVLAVPGSTRLTRAFSGRQARGIVNRFMREHGADAPTAYPDVHHLTAPIRAAARTAGDPEAINLWAGQAHALARSEPAADTVRRLGAEARDAVRLAARRLEPPR